MCTCNYMMHYYTVSKQWVCRSIQLALCGDVVISIHNSYYAGTNVCTESDIILFRLIFAVIVATFLLN